MTNSNVAVVIVNFRNLRDTIDCVNSLMRNISESDSIQAIVIDNGSGDGSHAELRFAFPGATVIGLKHNLGFAGASNVGISLAMKTAADYVFLLNNDAIVQSSTIENLLKVFDRSSTIGITGATVLDYNNPKLIDNMGAKINYFTGNSKLIANGEIYQENREDVDVDYVCGAAIMIKRATIDNVGLLPEYYFLYGEEKEYCVRAKMRGYRVVVTAKATVTHKVSSTVKNFPGVKNYYFHRNRFIFLKLHAKDYQYILAIIHSIFVIFPLYVLKYIINGRSKLREGFDELSNFVLGILDGLRFKTGYTKEVK